jgi:signal transduction histidine kinase
MSERQRILADMHDGLGASLITLLRHVQSGTADRASIEQRVQEALQEMRIAIDALQPREGDIAAVLGSLRYRLDDIIRSSGVSLVWEVEELPAVGELKPSAVFALQRMLLEAITNALKHSGARLLRVTARPRDPDVEISIEDDGCGFDPSQRAAGLGLANMRARAQRIGARVRIQTSPGRGTDVRISIPCDAAAAPSTSAPGQGAPQVALRAT